MLHSIVKNGIRMRDKLPKLQIAETLPNSGQKHNNRKSGDRSNSNGVNNRDGRNTNSQ